MTIPRQSYYFSSIVATLYFFFLVSLVLNALPSSTLHNCRRDQRDALLELKHEFPVNEFNSNSNDASLISWNKSSDCCFWKGIGCDNKSGEVTSLNLSYVPLNNSLKPNSGLFKLQNLRNLTLKNCSLYGELPSSLGNFSRLTKLNLLNNKLVGQVPASLGNLTKLRYLDLSQNYFTGIIPTSFANLTKLYLFYIHNNFFESTLPPDMSRLQNLIYFGVGENSFVGSFPTSLFTIPSLLYITLEGNHFKGPIEFGNTSLSSKLEFLVLHGNQFDGLVPESISQFLNLKELDLGFNSFTGPIPKSMSQLVNLYYLDFSYNKLEGKVPGCLWRLNVLKLSYNSLSSFETPDETKIKLIALDLNSNSFQGPFPHWICKLRSLMLLDMSNNMFNGSIPQCFWNSIGSLVELVLSHNNVSGSLPDIFANAIHLNAIDVSSNQLEGKLPKSLIHCRGMKFLNLKRNKIKDKFPFWLGSLPLLHVLLLGSNQFYGSLYHRHGLQNLRVIDVSHNDFSGTFPSFYFSNWREMTSLNTEHEDDTYMKDLVADAAFFHSMDMMHKGVDREFEKVREDFRAIDFSRNRLYGNIPQSIGLLKELRILNLSGNAFTSNIPQTLANLTNLEQLDLSWNQLSGQIPRDLASLSFLSTMDFSHNNLEGPIPRSTQFQSQNCSSFKDNPKLYGLEEFCGETHLPSPTPKESKDFVESEEQVINWIAAAIAYGPGLFCGLVIGHIFVSHNYYWFVEIFRRDSVCTILAR